MRALIIGIAVSLAGCGGSTKSTEPSTPTTPLPSAAPATADDMIARGGQLYAANCAGCHGRGGEGSDKAPAVVGQGALPLDPRPGQKRASQFRTALDVFSFAKQTMPPDAPGSLSDDEYLAIVAFALSANGVALEQPLDGETASRIVLH